MRIKRKITCVLTAILCGIPMVSSACMIPPPHLSDHHTQLVSSAKSIVLAAAVGLDDSDSSDFATFVFKPVETLKGESPARFELYGVKSGSVTASDNVASGDDYDGHRSPLFWAWGLGNSVMLSTCDAYGVFEVGEKYLIFIRDKPHVRAYEVIREDDDLWLAVIRLVAENYGDSVFPGFALDFESEDLTQCIKEVVSNDEYIYMREVLVTACIERHSTE